ncbi:MAG: hypothetical protein J6T06_03980 [Victivallales bacterium]|nr:hypothetical protein [Victivallales bacterium]
MTEAELRVSCPNVWKSYRAKKGAVTRLAKRSDHLRAQCQYTDYSDPPGIETWGIVELRVSTVLNYGIWEAVRLALIEAKKIAYDSVEFCFTHVC